jgi:hypothetical protein
MIGGWTPETCSAVNKRQDNKLENCCIWLVIYLNCTIMHGLTNLKKWNLIFENFSKKSVEIFLQSDKNNEHFTWRHLGICDII